MTRAVRAALLLAALPVLPACHGAAAAPVAVLLMRFASKQALDAYLVHPVHTRAVADVLTPNVRSVVVHDAVLR